MKNASLHDFYGKKKEASIQKPKYQLGEKLYKKFPRDTNGKIAILTNGIESHSDVADDDDNENGVWIIGEIKEVKSENDKSLHSYRVTFQSDCNDDKTSLLLPESQIDWGVAVHKYLNQSIAKYFDVTEDNPDGIFKGQVKDIVPINNTKEEGERTGRTSTSTTTTSSTTTAKKLMKNMLFHIVYEDGDEEDFDSQELMDGIDLFSRIEIKEIMKEATLQLQKSSNGRSKRRRNNQTSSKNGIKRMKIEDATKQKSKKLDDSDEFASNNENDGDFNNNNDKIKEDEESFDDDDDLPVGRVKKRRLNRAANRKGVKIEIDDDDDDDDHSSSQSSNDPVNKRTSRRGRKVAAVKYNFDHYDYLEDDNSDEFDSDSDDDENVSQKANKSTMKKNKISRKTQKVKSKKRKTKNGDDDDEDEYDYESEESEQFDFEDDGSDDDDDDEAFDKDLDDDDSLLFVDKGSSKKKRNSRNNSKQANDGTTTKAKQRTDADGNVKKTMAESFEPFDRPLYAKLSLNDIKKTKQYLDPCGQEATDDIIGRLVGEQVDKIQQLLQRTLEPKDNEKQKNGKNKNNNRQMLGSLEMPLRLGTACSGTDAPALALTLVQEQLELRGMPGLFNYSHVFSCENEPFKQAYLARNFDSVLYPDICKLTDPEPRDAYGQIQPIPEFNLFVAGTSCKNFSMLRANKRIDIEDKGCSGETFLAAVEFLFQQQPPFAILENVQNAPWDKMSEYITGKIKLSSCGEKKAIKGIKKSDKMILEFSLQDNGNIVVEKVPMVYGVRCGVSVAGYLRPGETKLREVKWPSHKKKKSDNSCTLDDLIKENNISKKNDTLVFDQPTRYHTQKLKVDTKDFGLPQTRNRMYMFVWRVDDGEDLGEYWKLIVEHLKSPVQHALEAFVLQVDHDIIRVFREALRGPSGRKTKRGAFLENDFWTSTSANLPHNKIPREKLGFKDMSRTLTQWGPFGKKQIPPHYWLEYINCFDQRRTDLLEILHASAARDAETHDSSFSSFVWNVSQNASREKHRTASPGISGCVTPGGDFFLPHMGRPLLGCEKLLLQGIPYFRLALGTETEVQLGDLAGNAMSLTVVCACMLAAITCPQLRDDVQKELGKSSKKKSGDAIACAKRILSASSIERKPDLTKGSRDKAASLSDGLGFITELIELSDEAIRTSIWCTCESSGQNSASTSFLQCSNCKVSICRNCCDSTAGYQLDSHNTTEVVFADGMRDVGLFETRLRNVLPPAIVFGEEGLAQIAKTQHQKGAKSHDVKNLANLQFTLHRISRERRFWKVLYFARESNVGEALAEFCLRIGDLCKLHGSDEKNSHNCGVRGEITSFLPARTAPLVYGHLEPIAVLTHSKSSGTQNWKTKSNVLKTSLNVVGSAPGPSTRSEIGLTDVAAKRLEAGAKKSSNKKTFAMAKKLGEDRRWLYAKNWKTWPETLTISFVDSSIISDNTVLDVSGTYHRAKCRQTVNQGAVWIREDDNPSLYFLLKPEVSRTGSDIPIISRSLNHDDLSSIVATLPARWQPCDALMPELQLVKDVSVPFWSPLSELNCLVPSSTISVVSPKLGVKSDTLMTVQGLTQMDVEMLLSHQPKDLASCGDKLTLAMGNGQRAQQTVRTFNSICVAKILQHAASSGIAYDLRPNAKWIEIYPKNQNVPFGTCSKTFPTRPKEIWRKDVERDEWDRVYEQGESRAFHQALEKRPRAFEFLLDKTAQDLAVKLQPEVVAHYSAGYLAHGRGPDVVEGIEVSIRLSASQFQADPVLDAFRVPSCHDENATDVGLKKPFHLYERQQKVVTKMLSIENKQTNFTEIEMYEEYMPGSTGWSLIAKAQREASIAGGVIADAIGAGKTVISIALVLRGLKESRKKAAFPRQSSATLVVVPAHLIDQWRNEFKKFSEGLKVLCIYDLTSLQKFNLKDLIEADCVICPVDILEAEGYLNHLLNVTKSNDLDDCPTMPRYAGQKELTGASGVWIPATSADPYGGANNSNNQRRRNASARYTHVYLSAVKKLRTQKFEKSKKGIPLEYFEWERIIVDEIHESLCCTKQEVATSNESRTDGGVFTERNRRAGRELLGIMTKDPKQRPLLYRKAIFGLTGTPLLDSPSRVIELASLIGSIYVLGLSSHWRKLERESCRDIFLHYYLEPKQSREIRRNLYEKCQDYITTACCRNKVGDEMNGITLNHVTKTINMSEDEGKLYLQSQSGIPPAKKSFAITPEDFDVTAGHDIVRFLRQNASLSCRRQMLIDICRETLAKDKTTKIIVFADGRIGAGIVAREALCSAEADGLGCTWLDEDDSNEVRNQKISWYQHGDATEEDKARPRILVLHFEHAAGLNLQMECYNLILFSPLYVGEGGANSDAVSDVSTELQAIGRVYRPGQARPIVNVYRIEARGPNDEECLDGQLIRRNTDEETKAMAVNASD